MNNCLDPCRQKHNHEFTGSTRYADLLDDRHNHRFAGVSSEAIPSGCSHVHRITTRTDYYGHFHEISVTTGPAIPVGNGKHVHLASCFTTFIDGHKHKYVFATLIEDPTL